MSNMLGGDLAAMGALARRFGQAGTDVESQLKGIGKEASDARDSFVKQMGTLKSQAETLDGEMTDALKALRTELDGTNWTGSNRSTLDQVYADMESQITSSQEKIRTFISEADDVVNGSLSDNLDTLNENVSKAGESANQTAASFEQSVTSQQQAFDRVLNS